MYIQDKNHTIWSVLWICSVVLCNICAGIRNLKPRYYVSLTDHFGVLARWTQAASPHALASNRPLPSGNAFMNYKWLCMIRIIQSYGFMNMWCHFTQCVSNYKNSEARLYCFFYGYFGIWQHGSAVMPPAVPTWRGAHHILIIICVYSR